jgi:hypothetical protein
MERPDWYFAEYSPVGVDLGSPQAVAAFDRNQGTDPAAGDALLDRLGVTAGTVMVDLACGTGSLVVQAARRGARGQWPDEAAPLPHTAAGFRIEQRDVPSGTHAGYLCRREG